MIVRYGNYSEKVRDKLDTDMEILHFQYHTKSKLKRAILNYFESIKEQDINCYCNILGMVLSDTYKLLNIKNKDGLATLEDKNLLEYYEGFNNKTAVSYFNINPEELILSCYNMSEFNSYDYFMKSED